MPLRLSPNTEAALLLVGIAVLHAAMTGWATSRSAADPEPRPAAPLGPGGRVAVQQCQAHVAIIHDVHWAAACMRNAHDDSPECTLPDDWAAPLNSARAAAEERCVHEASTVERVAGHRPGPHQ